MRKEIIKKLERYKDHLNLSPLEMIESFHAREEKMRILKQLIVVLEFGQYGWHYILEEYTIEFLNSLKDLFEDEWKDGSFACLTSVDKQDLFTLIKAQDLFDMGWAELC